MTDSPQITMTSFGKFMAADFAGQSAQVRDVKRQYDSDYRLAQDFWSRWRTGVEAIHRSGDSPGELEPIWQEAKDNRRKNYKSACDGYQRFWGRKKVELINQPTPVIWTCGRLRVKVNPEWMLSISGKPTLVKLHLSKGLKFEQRTANPLLYLMEQLFPGDHRVVLLDVHRGHSFALRTRRTDYDTMLRMSAAAFIVGWDLLAGPSESAA